MLEFRHQRLHKTHIFAHKNQLLSPLLIPVFFVAVITYVFTMRRDESNQYKTQEAKYCIVFGIQTQPLTRCGIRI
jgi:hypothetical protein